MSRIHEALKKAATERSAQLAGKLVAELVDLAGERLIDGVVPGEAQRPVVSPSEPGIRAYKELIAGCKKTEWKMQPRYSVFADEALYRHGAERFRTLRSRLYQIAATRTLKRVLVTSSLPEEGKTFVASNLAQSFIRQENKTVLLIDADLRASRLHLALGAPGTPGLSEYLRGEADEYKIIQVGKEGNLCFIPGGSGVSNPSELLHSEKMRSLLDRLTPYFDWVIMDSAPAIAVHDASNLADMCDGVLFVVRSGKTDFEVAQKGVAEFQEKNLLGVVLNRAEKGEGYGDYYYGYPAEKKAR